VPGLAEIAEAAGVSISTVSRVLNRRAGVNSQTRARALAVVADRPYTPREEKYVRVLLARGVDGMVFVSPEAADTSAAHDHYQRLVDEGVRMVFVNGGAPALDVPDVRVDEQVAGYLATRHLLELGHTRIGLVAGPLHSVPSRAETVGWQAALEEYGVTPDPGLVAHAEYGAAGGVEGTRQLLGFDAAASPSPHARVFRPRVVVRESTAAPA
jgi:DNA-binding LacI/PurR family transcriptional regulator